MDLNSIHQKLKSIDAKKGTMTLLDEFKAFAFKGNVVDLAVGVIIGAAFGNIVKSLVDHVIMPTVAVILPGKVPYHQWVVHVRGKPIPYGLFLADVVNFLIVSAVLFLFVVKFLGLLIRSKADEPPAPPAPTKDQELLTEIRDLLKARASNEAAPPTS